MGLITVCGAIANKHEQGGEAWVRLSYILGLRRLGCEAHFIEQIQEEHCVDFAGKPTIFENSVQLAYFQQVVDSFDLTGYATLVPIRANGGSSVDPCLLELARSSDAMLNISGHLALQPLFSRFRNKIYLDIDPGYTQYWNALGNTGARMDGHDWFFTIGENIGTSHCPIPTGNIEWHHTRPPVLLDEWPARDAVRLGTFTTIANWRGSYGVIQFGEQTFGQKVHEFRKFLSLPERVRADFEIALNIHQGDEKDLAALQHHGWRVSDPKLAAATPEQFRQYVQKSGAEFSVAQGIYVQTNCGWFSDRTVRYLATGKPALVQETGFSRNLPVGKGLVSFRTLEQAIRGAESIMTDYDNHCAAARRIAVDYFDSDVVLGHMLEEIGITP